MTQDARLGQQAHHDQPNPTHEVTGNQEIDLRALRLWQELASDQIQDYRFEAWCLCVQLASLGRCVPGRKRPESLTDSNPGTTCTVPRLPVAFPSVDAAQGVAQ